MPESPTEVRPRPELRRAADTPLAGVCFGLARHLEVSVPTVRAAMIGLAVAGGIGVVLYCWLWIFVPADDEETGEAAVRGLSGPAADGASSGAAPAGGTDRSVVDAGRDDFGVRLRRLADALTGSPEVLLGGLLLGGALLMLTALLGADLNWWVIAPPAVLTLGVLVAWPQVDRPDSARGAGDRPGPLRQVAVGSGLVVLALVLLVAGLVPLAELVMGLVIATMLVAGLGLVAAPWLIRLYRTATTQRARAAAEAERADIAAHLHDSVLQTLAMIQKQRHDPEAVGTLARLQERQLRGWLYRRDGAEPGTLKDQLLAVAAELEEQHGVAVDVVAVGSSGRHDHRVLVAAAREAMLNAVRHAGPASVYIESDETGDAVYVRDRGPGFDPRAVDADRLGIRESIVGRMRRAGGEAVIRFPGSGTEVRLQMPVEAEAEPGTESGTEGGRDEETA
ncbi:ATP-binding protein [Nesterenkonia marinintestina]|uniref:ATP-binding protein n=1 Tax=Nesterenkonia marinintestina TaxID=2979865 RepID=UPI0021C01BC5|nr:ATP-binding protein [Nesterenkonia sp. GX14115]